MKFTIANQKEFINLLKKIKPYQSTEPTRHYLNGVYFHLAEGELNLVAADGYRLIKVNTHATPEDCKDGEMLGAIVPSNCINTLIVAKGLNKNLPLIIRINNLEAEFDFIGFKVVTKLVDGIFPDYQKVIPKVEEVKSTHGFRSAYLVDALKTFGNKGVRVGWNQESEYPESEPVLIKGQSDDIISVLMPMRI